MECLSVSHAIRGGHRPSAAAAGRRCRAEEGRGSRSLWEIIPLPTSVLQRRCWLAVKVRLPVSSNYWDSPTPVGAAATRRPLFSSYFRESVKFPNRTSLTSNTTESVRLTLSARGMPRPQGSDVDVSRFCFHPVCPDAFACLFLPIRVCLSSRIVCIYQVLFLTSFRI